MLYLASSVTMPLSLAALLLFLCIGEAVVIFYLLGSKNKSVNMEETPDTSAAPGQDNAKDNRPDEEDLAVILSVMCEELNARPEELEFKEIRLVS